MLYKAVSLNGDWKMGYCVDKYDSQDMPQFNSFLIEDAVPGYWEDMIEKFSITPFYRNLKINPSYGIQKYPIYGDIPDMALPNIMGNFFYKRKFIFEGNSENTFLYFSGVQNCVCVWINGIYIGKHEGYSVEFDMKIPDNLLNTGENEIVMSVSNHRLKGYSDEPVSGLTNRAANEYTGGITGDIEIREYFSQLKDIFLRVSDDCNTVYAETIPSFKANIRWAVYDGEILIKEGTGKSEFSFDSNDLLRWSPENPKLYTLRITCEDAFFERKFGVRYLKTDGVHLNLNGYPYFLRGVCEHCYFPETVHPHHDKDYYKFIINKMKELGFNFIRFHTFVPYQEYMETADELGMLIQVECPNNTLVEEWLNIVKACRKHPSVVIYCCGNELTIDEDFIEHLEKCSEIVHKNSDSLFSPMSALRGLEYRLDGSEYDSVTIEEPFRHHPNRIKKVGEFSDVYNSYALGKFSYCYLEADPEENDRWSDVYNKPRLSHEICIDGTYTDLSLKDRYKNTRIGKTEMFTSLEGHLKEKGVLKSAPLYFKNSSEWQRRIRKYCFEALRRSENMAGYDFLGPIDTHWHTFGYDVGMMNEFYELKPGETVRNVLMYNSQTVLLTDIDNFNIQGGHEFSFGIYTSYYDTDKMADGSLNIRFICDNEVIIRKNIKVSDLENGKVSKIYDFSEIMPETDKCKKLKLYITLESEKLFCENEWELYLYPVIENAACSDNVIITDKINTEDLFCELSKGRSVVLFGAEPFKKLPTSYKIALAGRSHGNLATVVANHPLTELIPNEGFCGWQFAKMLENGEAISFECEGVPFNPIVEVVSTHKFVIKQSILFEFSVGNGKLLVCGFNFKNNDFGAKWFRNEIIKYASSELFNPKDSISFNQLSDLIDSKTVQIQKNKNEAFNINDITATRRKK